MKSSISLKAAICIGTVFLMQTAVWATTLVKNHKRAKECIAAFDAIASETEQALISELIELKEAGGPISRTSVTIMATNRSSTRKALQRSYLQWVENGSSSIFSRRDISYAAYKKEFDYDL